MITYRINYYHSAADAISYTDVFANSEQQARDWFEHPRKTDDLWRNEVDITSIEHLQTFTICYQLLSDNKYYAEVFAKTAAEARLQFIYKFPARWVVSVLVPAYISDGSDYVAR